MFASPLKARLSGRSLRSAGCVCSGLAAARCPNKRREPRQSGSLPRAPASNGAAQKDATGHCIRLGIAPDKLYTSILLYDENEYTATFLDAGTQYFYAVDAFNEKGITQGEVRQMEG